MTKPLTVPAPTRPIDGLLLDAMDSTSGWTPTGCTLAANADWFTQGTASVKLTGTSSGINADIVKTGLSIPLAGFESITFDVNVETDLGDGVGQAFYVSLGIGGFTNYFTYVFGYCRKGITRNVTIHKDMFTANGTAAWTDTCDRIFIRAGSVTSKTIAVSIDNIRINRKLPQAAGIIIGCDDCHDDHYDFLFPAMQERGLLLTLYVVRDWVGLSANNFTKEQLDEMHDAGVCVCNHSIDHFDALGLVQPHYGGEATYKQVYDNYSAMMDWQIENGYTRDDEHLFGAYPRGSVTTNVVEACNDLGFKMMRCVNGGLQAQNVEPYTSMMRNQNITPDGRTGQNAETFAAFKPYIDRIISTKAIGEITLHQMITGSPSASDQVTQSVTLEILDYIQEKVAAGQLVSMTPPMTWNAMRSNG